MIITDKVISTNTIILNFEYSDTNKMLIVFDCSLYKYTTKLHLVV